MALAVGGLIADPGNDSATHLTSGYNLWRLKGRARVIVFGNGDAGASKPCVPGKLPVLGDPIVEVGRIATIDALVVGELMQYPQGPGIDVRPAAWFILDADANTAIKCDDRDAWMGELRARGIDPKTLELVEFP